jgi:hypothetical protein
MLKLEQDANGVTGRSARDRVAPAGTSLDVNTRCPALLEAAPTNWLADAAC